MLIAHNRLTYSPLLMTLIFISLIGCTTQLAPPYDKAVTEILNLANTEAMTLLVATAHGTDKSTFSVREERYNALIGRLEALVLLAGARPMPKNKVTEVINKLVEKRGGKPIDDDDSIPPSAHSIRKIAETITVMRNTDKKQGVSALEVNSFKGIIVIYFDQAITYENFLQR